MIRRIVFAAALAALASSRLVAQIAPETVRGIAPGTRIRVSAVAVEDRIESRDANDKRWRTGVLSDVTADGLVLQTNPSRPDALVTLPFGVIQEIQVSRGRLNLGRGVRRGALQGTAAGAISVGILVALGSFSGSGECDPLHDPLCSPEDVEEARRSGSLGERAKWAGIFVGTGALLGAVVGTRAREVWEPAARHVTVSSAASGGTGVGLSFRI
jgi:hypothetical protein